MSEAVTRDHKIIVVTMLTSFHNWAKNSPKFKSIYKKIPEHYNVIIKDAFIEMEKHTPKQMDYWYVKNHMRYSKRLSSTDKGHPTYRQENKMRVKLLMENFLAEYGARIRKANS